VAVIAEDRADGEVGGAGGCGGEGDLRVRRDRAPGGVEGGGLDLEPQHHVGVDAEHRFVDVEVEVEQSGLAKLLDPPPHRGLVPVRRGGQVGDRSPAVNRQFVDELVVLGAQHRGVPGAGRRRQP
jgi:hypothetical protein